MTETSKRLILFSNHPISRYGGMENHGLYMAHYFRNSTQCLLLAIISKSEEFFFVDALDGRPPLRVISTLHLVKYLKTLVDGHTSILFFNSGHWIETLPVLRRAFPTSQLMQRTGGNDFLEASMTNMNRKLYQRQRFWIKAINSHLDCLIANSAFTRRRLEMQGVDPTKSIVVSGGVDLGVCRRASSSRSEMRARWFGSENNAKHVLCASRLVDFKGVDTSIEAVGRLVKAFGSAVKLWIAGDGPLERELRIQGRKVLGKTQCTFLGPLSPRECIEAVAGADVLCCLSREWTRQVSTGSYVHTETMGRVVYEAIACGTRVVGAEVGGLPEVVLPMFGSLVPPDDPELAAVAVLREFGRPRSSMQTLKTFHDRYSWNSVFDGYFREWDKYA